MYITYIIRTELYEEEFRPEQGIPQQVCVLVRFNYKPMELYSVHREGGLLIQDVMLKKKVTTSEFQRLIVYVQSGEIALKLAERWCNEPDQKKRDYRVEGIDRYYSVFD